ncbi:hypothetical protein PHMEG_00038378, partial [Phytophthora megakarya]
MRTAEDEVKLLRQGNYDSRITAHTTDSVLSLVNTATADMFATNEPDQSVLVPVFQRRSFVDDVCFGGTTFDDCLGTLDKLLMRFEECRISISFTKSIFCQSKKKGVQQFLGALNYYGRFIQDFAVFGAVLYQLKDGDFTDEGDVSGAKESFRIL